MPNNTAIADLRLDVQLTRDLVPVIFHDFSLSESGTDVPIHDLTVEQVNIPPTSIIPKAHRYSSNTQASFSPPVRNYVRNLDTGTDHHL